MQKVYIDSRGYAWHLMDGGVGCYRRDIDLPGRIGVIQLAGTIEEFYDQDPPSDWTPRRRSILRRWLPRR